MYVYVYVFADVPFPLCLLDNGRELKEFLQGKGYVFVSDTDTEVIAKLIQYLYDQDETKQKTFRQLVEEVSAFGALLGMRAVS